MALLGAVYQGVKNGLSQKMIAKAACISLTTLKQKMDQFGPNLKIGQEDRRYKVQDVKDTLLKRALGYEYIEVHEESGYTHKTGGYEKTKKMTKQKAT